MRVQYSPGLTNHSPKLRVTVSATNESSVWSDHPHPPPLPQGAQITAAVATSERDVIKFCPNEPMIFFKDKNANLIN